MATAPDFGTCCEELRQAMHSKANSSFQVDDGLLLLTICTVPMQGLFHPTGAVLSVLWHRAAIG